MPDRNGDTPLLLAAKEGHDEVVTSLAQYNIDVEMADAQGNPCIRHTHRVDSCTECRNTIV